MRFGRSAIELIGPVKLFSARPRVDSFVSAFIEAGSGPNILLLATLK
jgi:hypothetical protein